MSVKKWNVLPCDVVSAEKMADTLGIPKILAVLLQTRGYTDPEQIRNLFENQNSFTDPFLLKDMDQAAQRILAAIDGFESIAVYGDYDADGITATAMLYSYLESCGANVTYYIPDREGEGYGLNLGAIKVLREKEINLIVTVDNGISSVDEVAYANSLGMDVVITDHHRPREILPPACAVVDPYRPDDFSPFKDFSGVGIAFKLIMALEGEDCDLTSLLDNYSDLVAIGTIGDVVPLNGENRSFVRAGLESIARTDRIGLKALLEQAGMEGRKLTANQVAFTIVPRINATGRIGSPDRAVRLLISEFPDEAVELSTEICDDNDYRRQIESEIFEKVIEILKEHPERLYDRVLVVEGENWHQGVIGIVSSRITELFGKPSVIISYSGGEAKGSGRSVEGFSLFEAVCSCESLLTKFGGHPMAAGLSLPTEKIDAFRTAINAYAAKHSAAMPVPILRIDCLLQPDELSTEIPRCVSMLEPFGMGNPAPLFGLFGVTLTDLTPVGGGKHLRVSVSRGNYTVRCMKFGTTLEEFPYHVGDRLDLAVTLDAREYNGKNTLSIYIRDIKLSGSGEEELFAGFALYERYHRGEPLSSAQGNRLLPNRDDFAAIYRLLRAQNGYSGNAEVLLAHLGRPGMKVEKLLIALEVLAERNLILFEFFAGKVTVEMLPVSQKVNLMDSYIIHNLCNLKKDGEHNGVASQDL